LATPPPIPLRAVFAAIWNGIGEVFVRLRRPALTALTIYLVFAILDAFIEPDRSLLRSLPEGIRDVLLVPFSLAIFRLLILGEVASQRNLNSVQGGTRCFRRSVKSNVRVLSPT
jgi:hypothetical protein